MNNEIEEDRVSSEIAKLLKEKGFNIEQAFCFIQGGIRKPRVSVRLADVIGWECTHSLAIKWIRENFGIHLSVDYDGKNWFAVLSLLPNKDRQIYGEFTSPEKATEAALLYTLKNLI